MFTAVVDGQVLRFALLPPYLQKLGRSRKELEATAGWELTSAALRAMKAECARHQISFVLMFVPEKTQVYWPLAERFFSPAKLQEAADFYSQYTGSMTRIDDVRMNRLAQNDLLREFCAAEGIPMVDLTDVLERQVQSGRQVYFPDDTHWNAHGHDVAARELARFLADRP